MNITILGAAGKTGQQAVDYALSQGHTVTALVRDAEQLASRKGLKVVQGDATVAADIVKASTGSDVIVSTLGSTKGGLMEKAVKAVVKASEKTGVTNFTLMDSLLSRRDQLSGFQSFISNKMMRKMVEDKLASEKILRASNLNWTIVYATMLHNKDTGKKVVMMGSDDRISPKNKISRANAAKWMVDNAASSKPHTGEVIITEQ